MPVTKQNDRLNGVRLSASDPAVGGVAFTGTADVTLDTYARGVYISTAGDLKVDLLDGSIVTFSNLLAGVVYPFAITKVYDTGTTAAGVALY